MEATEIDASEAPATAEVPVLQLPPEQDTPVDGGGEGKDEEGVTNDDGDLEEGVEHEEGDGEAAAEEDSPPPQDSYSKMTPDEIREELRAAKRDTVVLNRENEYLSYFVARRLGEGDDLASLEAALGYDQGYSDEEEEEEGGEGSKSARLRPKRLTLVQQRELLEACLEEAKRDQAPQKALGALKTLQVVVAQAGMRLEDIKALTREFTMAVVVRGKNARTGAIQAEAVTRYYEESLRRRADKAEKLTWKAGVLKKELDKVTGEGKTAVDSSSELMRYINFHQLRIENAQFTAQLAEKTRTLLALKASAIQTSELVLKLKAELSATSRAQTALKARIKEHHETLRKAAQSGAEVTKTLSDLRATLGVNEQRALDAQGMPEVLDYMAIVRAHGLLKRELVLWQRKVEVATGGGTGGGGGGGGGGRSHSASFLQPHTMTRGASSSSSSSSSSSASTNLTATGYGKGRGSSTFLPTVSTTRPMGTTASINRVLYGSVGTGAVAPSATELRRTMGAKVATEAAEAMSGRTMKGGGVVATLTKAVTGGGPVPRGVGGFSGGLASSLSRVGAGGVVVSKLHLGSSGIKGPPVRSSSSFSQ